VCQRRSDIAAAYPQITFRHIEPKARLPFEDDAFDIAYSNAVIEHVGGLAERRAFIEEHLRVAKAVFITFPNRWFPVEYHTGIPLLHYSPALFRTVLSRTKLRVWSDARNVDFLDARQVSAEWPSHAKPKMIQTGLLAGTISSNVAAIYKGS